MTGTESGSGTVSMYRFHCTEFRPAEPTSVFHSTPWWPIGEATFSTTSARWNDRLALIVDVPRENPEGGEPVTGTESGPGTVGMYRFHCTQFRPAEPTPVFHNTPLVADRRDIYRGFNGKSEPLYKSCATMFGDVALIDSGSPGGARLVRGKHVTGTESRSGNWVFVPPPQHPIPSRRTDFRFSWNPPAAGAQTRQLLRSTTESVRCRTGATSLYKSCARPGMQTYKNEGWHKN